MGRNCVEGSCLSGNCIGGNCLSENCMGGNCLGGNCMSGNCLSGRCMGGNCAAMTAKISTFLPHINSLYLKKQNWFHNTSNSCNFFMSEQHDEYQTKLVLGISLLFRTILTYKTIVLWG